MVLLLLEIFVIPGFGIAGITGFILIIAGLMTVRLPEEFFTPGRSMKWRMDTFAEPVGVVFGGLIAGLVGIAVIARYLPKTSLFSKYVVTGPPEIEAVGGGGVTVSQQSAQVHENDVGVAATDLRPSGKVEVGGHSVVAVSNGDYIEKGSRVRIVRIKGNQVFVEEI